jgi:hypothetical protein
MAEGKIMDESLCAEMQEEVERKLGHCLIRIQQYELLLKEIVAKREISGALSDASALLTENVSAVASKTMGHLVGELTQKCFRPTLLESGEVQPELASEDEDEHPVGWARFQWSVSMPPDAHAKLKSELQELVEMRNDLVHHFLEEQDLLSVEGCIAADMYLQDCYAEIDRHLASLRSSAASMNEAKLTLLSFMSSPQYREHLAAALSPTAIQRETALPLFVELLQRAEAAGARDGWMLLSDAIAFARNIAPDDTLAKHSFRSWRQVIHDAQVFEVRRIAAKPGGPIETWYRSRGGPAASP